MCVIGRSNLQRSNEIHAKSWNEPGIPYRRAQVRVFRREFYSLLQESEAVVEISLKLSKIYTNQEK